MTSTDYIQSLIEVAANEVGYLEKSNSAYRRNPDIIYSKTEGAGNDNICKYWQEIYPSYSGQPWCACFVTWCLVQVVGKANAANILRHYPFVYCPTLASIYSLNANPKVGDIVLFYRKGEFAHTGIVTAVNGDYFNTIEGNTSGGSTIVANGGGVCKKGYYNSNLPGTKFVTLDWSSVVNHTINPLELLAQKGYITDTKLWSNSAEYVTKAECLALVDKITGGLWLSEEDDVNIHWSQPHLISLCGKGYISNKENWYNFDEYVSKASVLALVAKHINNGGKELNQYERQQASHWGNNYLKFLVDRGYINTPEYWSDDFDDGVRRDNFLALIAKGML